MAKCSICGSSEGVRHYALMIDGVALRVELDLCEQHGETYVFRTGRVIGQLLREQREAVASVTVELSARTAELLRVLGDPAEVLEQLADHAQQGVYRPSAWEREWLVQAFGPMFVDKLETDPGAPYFQRPIDRKP